MKKSLPYILDFAFLTVGSFILALGVNMFLAPNKISSGGVSTICTILLHIFNIKMSITNIVCNIVLFLLGFKYLGKYAVVKTAYGILALTAFFEGESFEDVIRTAVSLGGDCDTLTCIAGSIAEAYYGVPGNLAIKVLKMLPEELKAIYKKFLEYTA